MAEWLDTALSYRPSDFLMFAPRSLWRLVALHNAAWWPLGLAFGAAGLAVIAAACRRARWAPHAGWLLLALACAFVAVAWQLQRYAAINTGAPWLAAGFGVQALLAAAAARAPAPTASPLRRGAGLALWLVALAAWPLLGLAAGRPLAQAEAFGLMPDPLLAALLGMLLLAPPRRAAWALWLLPLAGCALASAALATMAEPLAPLPAAAALLALAAAAFSRRPAPSAPGSA